MLKTQFSLSFLILIIFVTSCSNEPEIYQSNFPSSIDPIPVNWEGEVFKISDQYPKNLNKNEQMPWYEFNPKTQPLKYLESVLDYIKEGNLGTNFRGYDNPVRKWYHPPMKHIGFLGREFIHGLNREPLSFSRTLHPKQDEVFQNWALAMYNDRGAYTFG